MGSEHLCRKTEVRNKGFHRVMIFLQEALITKFCLKALKCNQRRV
jgi:hypothetical protein